MPRGNRKVADEVLLVAWVCGGTVEQAAAQAGISRRTALRRLADSAFTKRLTAMSDELAKRPARMLTAASPESVNTLLRLLDPSNPPGVQLGAARAVLQLAMKQREATELEERLAELERHFVEGDAPPPGT